MSFAGKVTPLDAGAMTDVFANPSALARKGEAVGLDLRCTKAAIDLQNMRDPDADEVIVQPSDLIEDGTRVVPLLE